MKTFKEITLNENIALALGYFDGIHIGHKKIISTLINEAKLRGLKTAVVTFSKNPANYFSGDFVSNIQTSKQRERILASMDIDYLYEVDFGLYKDYDPLNYIENVLVKNFTPKLIVTGYNHTFGKDRTGTPLFLEENSKKFAYDYIMVSELKYNNSEKVSSSVIRDKIKSARLEEVKKLLKRNFSIENTVIRGDKLATSLGYPTANINYPDGITKLPYGVYYCHVELDLISYPALVSWGNKPTLSDGKKETVEIHIYNFNKDIYDKTIEVFFHKKIREEKKFENISELKTQLNLDYIEFEKWVKLTF